LFSPPQVDKHEDLLGFDVIIAYVLKFADDSSVYIIWLYGLECFHLGKADLQSLDFTFNRLCMKLFKTGSIDVVKYCLSCFAIDLPSCICTKAG